MKRVTFSTNSARQIILSLPTSTKSAQVHIPGSRPMSSTSLGCQRDEGFCHENYSFVFTTEIATVSVNKPETSNFLVNRFSSLQEEECETRPTQMTSVGQTRSVTPSNIKPRQTPVRRSRPICARQPSTAFVHRLVHPVSASVWSSFYVYLIWQHSKEAPCTRTIWFTGK